MYYSNFIYYAAKAGSEYGDPAMTYENFLMGKMGETDDYAGFLDKAFREANAFFQRLFALNLTALKVYSADAEDDSSEFELPTDCGKVLHVFQFTDPKNTKYRNFEFRKEGNKVVVIGDYSRNRKVCIQYRAKAPVLGAESIKWIENVQDANGLSTYFVDGTFYTSPQSALEMAQKKQIDLEAVYGIGDDVLFIGIDWIRGRLNDNESKGHSQEAEAETRLQDIAPNEYEYEQIMTGGVRL